MPRITIRGPDQDPHKIAIDGEVSIGRHPQNVVALLDPSVSNRHARLVVERDESWIEDLGSSNGTAVNGERVAPNVHVPLVGGERVAIGPYEIAYTADNTTESAASFDGIVPVQHNVRSPKPRRIRILAIVAVVSIIVALASVVLKRVL